MSNTLTSRVTWVMTATVALFVGLMAVLAFSIMYEQEDELADQLVQIEMQRLIERIETGEISVDRQPFELGPRTEAWRSGTGADRAMPAALRGLSTGPHEIELDGRILHALVAESRGEHVTVVFDATQNERRVTHFGLIMLLLWMLSLIAGYWLARAAAGIVVGRMQAITERIADWDPDTAKPAEQTSASKDEAGRLLDAFNRMQDRVDRSIAREREFTANLSHEIRTPLAALRTDIEMAALDGNLAYGQRTRFERMANALDEVSATIDATRALSRSHRPANRQPFDLGELIDDVCTTMTPRAEAVGLQMSNEVPSGYSLQADRYALQIVLRNLIGNAVDHAAPARLMIWLDGKALVLEDDGHGIGPDELPFVFERFHHGRLVDQASTSDSTVGDHGLGLAIAQRVCEQQGWLISVTSTTLSERHGTRFELIFDENST